MRREYLFSLFLLWGCATAPAVDTLSGADTQNNGGDGDAGLIDQDPTVDDSEASVSDGGRHHRDAGGRGEAGSGDAGNVCAYKLTSSNFAPSDPSCSFAEEVTQTTGGLAFECDGGAAEIIFDQQKFTGTFQGGTVTVTSTADYTMDNTCGFHSTQTITGNLTSGTLSYTYKESKTTGDCSSYSTCSATAKIALSPM